MFCGFKSRCRIRRSCRKCSPSQMCCSSRQTRSSRRLPRRWISLPRSSQCAPHASRVSCAATCGAYARSRPQHRTATIGKRHGKLQRSLLDKGVEQLHNVRAGATSSDRPHDVRLVECHGELVRGQIVNRHLLHHAHQSVRATAALDHAPVGTAPEQRKLVVGAARAAWVVGARFGRRHGHARSSGRGGRERAVAGRCAPACARRDHRRTGAPTDRPIRPIRPPPGLGQSAARADLAVPPPVLRYGAPRRERRGWRTTGRRRNGDDHTPAFRMFECVVAVRAPLRPSSSPAAATTAAAAVQASNGRWMRYVACALAPLSASPQTRWQPVPGTRPIGGGAGRMADIPPCLHRSRARPPSHACWPLRDAFIRLQIRRPASRGRHQHGRSRGLHRRQDRPFRPHPSLLRDSGRCAYPRSAVSVDLRRTSRPMHCRRSGDAPVADCGCGSIGAHWTGQ